MAPGDLGTQVGRRRTRVERPDAGGLDRARASPRSRDGPVDDRRPTPTGPHGAHRDGVSRRCRAGRGPAPAAAPCASRARRSAHDDRRDDARARPARRSRPAGSGAAAAAASPTPSTPRRAPARRRAATPAGSASAISGPTSSVPLADARRPRLVVSSQPRSATSRRCRAEQQRVPGVRPGRTAAGAAPARRGLRRAGPARARRALARGSAARARSAGRGAGGVRAASALRRRQRTRVTVPPCTSYAAAGQRLRHVAGHRRRHQHLLGAGDQLRQPVAPPGVELGEHVVEDQHRLAVAVAVVRAAARTTPAAAPARTTRTRRGWRTPCRQRRRASSTQLVAVRADEARPRARSPAARTRASSASSAAASSSRSGDRRHRRRRATTGRPAPAAPARPTTSAYALATSGRSASTSSQPGGEQLGAGRARGGCPRRPACACRRRRSAGRGTPS